MGREGTQGRGLGHVPCTARRARASYASNRNTDPGSGRVAAVSRLSPAVRYRLVAEQDVTTEVLGRHSFDAAGKFIQEVCWCTYWKGWLELRPVVWQRFLAERDAARDAMAGSGDLAAAEEGPTGIDCFDTWVRELAEKGYFHNHARMWFALIWIFTLRLLCACAADDEGLATSERPFHPGLGLVAAALHHAGNRKHPGAGPPWRKCPQAALHTIGVALRVHGALGGRGRTAGSDLGQPADHAAKQPTNDGADRTGYATEALAQDTSQCLLDDFRAARSAADRAGTAPIAQNDPTRAHTDACGLAFVIRDEAQAIIAEAAQRGVGQIWVASFDFQAPAFYERAGFVRMAEFAGWPAGHANVILKLTLPFG